MNLKNFINKSIGISILFAASYVIFSSLVVHFFPSFSTKLFFKQDWLKVNERLEVSKGKINGDTLYVGSSVAGQLFPYDKNNQLTTNGSTYPIGNYFIIKNAIQNNPNIKQVIYLSVPDVIGHRISRERTYGYFVKPFYNFENKDEILESQSVREVLKKNKYLDLCLFDSYKLLSTHDFNYSDGKPKFLFEISDEAFEWLSKIDSLCSKNRVNFQLASPPVPISKQEKSNNWSDMKNKVANTHLEPLFEKYFATIQYLDDKYLKDEIHWKDSLIRKNRGLYVNTILKTLEE